MELYLIPLCVDFGGVETKEIKKSSFFCVDISILLTIYVFQQPKEYWKSTQTQTQTDSSNKAPKFGPLDYCVCKKIWSQKHDASKSRGPKFGPLLQRVRRTQLYNIFSALRWVSLPDLAYPIAFFFR